MPDLPGYGLSVAPAELFSYARWVDCVADLLQAESQRTGRPVERRIFPEGKDPKDRPYDDLRWSRFRHFAPAEIDFHLDSAHLLVGNDQEISGTAGRVEHADARHALTQI